MIPISLRNAALKPTADENPNVFHIWMIPISLRNAALKHKKNNRVFELYY